LYVEVLPIFLTLLDASFHRPEIKGVAESGYSQRDGVEMLGWSLPFN